MGAGKTTAIGVVSDIPPIITDVMNTDTTQHTKATTTVGIDYGEVDLGQGEKLLLFGTPGQERFDFMWEILARRALGIILLVDNSRPDPMADMNRFLDVFAQFSEEGAIVIGIGRTEGHPKPGVEDYHREVEKRKLVLPVFAVDVRRKKDVKLLLNAMLSTLEARER
ncbi:MAG: GTP-binding protein [Burkholderiaceae bacterium]|nr:MAG: GTP-binding protein [Burkholderiaceae bacterium]